MTEAAWEPLKFPWIARFPIGPTIANISSPPLVLEKPMNKYILALMCGFGATVLAGCLSGASNGITDGPPKDSSAVDTVHANLFDLDISILRRGMIRKTPLDFRKIYRRRATEESTLACSGSACAWRRDSTTDSSMAIYGGEEIGARVDLEARFGYFHSRNEPSKVWIEYHRPFMHPDTLRPGIFYEGDSIIWPGADRKIRLSLDLLAGSHICVAGRDPEGRSFSGCESPQLRETADPASVDSVVKVLEGVWQLVGVSTFYSHLQFVADPKSVTETIWYPATGPGSQGVSFQKGKGLALLRDSVTADTLFELKGDQLTFTESMLGVILSSDWVLEGDVFTVRTLIVASGPTPIRDYIYARRAVADSLRALPPVP